MPICTNCSRKINSHTFVDAMYCLTEIANQKINLNDGYKPR